MVKTPWPSGWCIGLRSKLRGFDAQLGHLHDACTTLPQKSSATIKWLEIKKKRFTICSYSDYVNVYESNVFFNLVSIPTRVTPNSQTIIDHILTNDSESILTPGVILYKISDHNAISCNISSPRFNNSKTNSSFMFRNTKSI